MSKKDRLNALFVEERNRLTDQYDLLAANDRATDSDAQNDIWRIVTDFVMGHVYRLLEKFGTKRALSFEDGCPSLTYLKQQDIHESYFVDIKRAYYTELDVSRLDEFSDRLRPKMQRHKILETAATKELVKQYYFRAHSDANLDIEDRYPSVDMSFLYHKANDNQDGRPSDINDASMPSASKSTTVGSVTMEEGDTKLVQPLAASDHSPQAVDAIGSEETTGPNSYPSLDSTPSSDQHREFVATSPTLNTVAPVPAQSLAPTSTSNSTASSAAASSHSHILPVLAFEAECDKLITNMGDEWTKGTAGDVKALVSMFQSVLAEHGVNHSGEVEQYHIGMLRQHFNHIPTHWGKSPRLKAMSAPIFDSPIYAVTQPYFQISPRIRPTMIQVIVSMISSRLSRNNH